MDVVNEGTLEAADGSGAPGADKGLAANMSRIESPGSRLIRTVTSAAVLGTLLSVIVKSVNRESITEKNSSVKRVQ